ncbi:DNA-binding response regulator [Bacillus pseudomycoides]|uniref:DNA-binding response regulator n=1 Tax=Bacillus pseudomycoides TaxID=64104 RepID=A0AA91VFH2_9BACI|nr:MULTISPECIES: response regulator transcription factor [Bacillus]PEB54357.1 DNA-binding response regulator [Bacillus sp. AFS098217]PED83962.1 DNA-binding response regulator [Bacillus pseudomycoides]PEU16636.1 DNA-binding response regulator [Bacillus sp. AFS019443]
MNIKILYAEDDKEINDLVATYLRKEGYFVDQAYDGEEAVTLFKQNNYSLVLLDLMLPKLDGFELLRRFRLEKNIPIVVLSAKIEDVDKIFALGLGADDYIIKPFSIGELIARIKAQLRRFLYLNDYQDIEPSKIKQGIFELDFATYTINKRDITINLTKIEFELLKLFMSNPRRVFSKSHIYSNIWTDNYDIDENTVMVHISKLRSKIEDDSSQPKYLQTVWGIGYKWEY